MKEILECNSIYFKSCTTIPDFSAEDQLKTENRIANGIELDFSTNLFNKINITVPPVFILAVLFNDIFCQRISHSQLNWISDRELENLASST